VKEEDIALSELIQREMDLEIPATLSMDEIKEILMLHIAHLIDHDFEKLVFILYRVDVNETKMRALLEQQQGKDAAGLIADLIIERQLQKIKTRQEFTNRDKNIDEDEKW